MALPALFRRTQNTAIMAATQVGNNPKGWVTGDHPWKGINEAQVILPKGTWLVVAQSEDPTHPLRVHHGGNPLSSYEAGARMHIITTDGTQSIYTQSPLGHDGKMVTLTVAEQSPPPCRKLFCCVAGWLA